MTRLLPGATVGVLGGGQLGQMLMFEAHRMGYRIHVMDPDPEGPAAPWADHHIPASWDDREGALELADGVDVATFETEHIPADALDEVATRVPLRPGPDVLRVIQDRLTQRRFLERHSLPQPRYAAVEDLESLHAALQETGAPAVLKSRTGGYDGKGQVVIRTPDEAESAWDRLGAPAVLEAFVPFQKEVSVVLARTEDGNTAAWPLAENVHVDGVLHTTRVPADVDDPIPPAALDLATRAIEALGHVGVAAVEMFLVGGELLINEIAPRTHNSGHFTYGAAVTSQFEQHLRAICDLPLGDPSLLRPVAMVNLLGDLWARGEPDWNTVLEDPDAKLHLYGKNDARPGRKMGHILVTAADGATALARAEGIHARLAEAAGLEPARKVEAAT